MNLFYELMIFRNAIKSDGWIILPPQDPEGGLRIRVEWYEAEKYGFEMYFSVLELKLAKRSLSDIFINRANHEFERLTNEQEKNSG